MYKTSERPQHCLKHSVHKGTLVETGKGKKQRVQRRGGEIAAGFMSQADDKPSRDTLVQADALNQD